MVKVPRDFRLRYPLILLIICGLSYGLLIPWLGFYWDDLPMGWIPYQLGPEGTARYFSTNRPVWGWLYMLTTPVLGLTPWAWQVFAILFRWISGIALWRVMRRVWPDRPWIAAYAGFLLVLFPAFRQQYIALLYSHFFVVLSAFLFSFDCMLASIEYPQRRIIYTGIGLLLSAMNLFMLEYFFLLEFIRPFMIWYVSRREILEFRHAIWKFLKIWIPYLSLFVTATLWRIFFYPYQTEYYQFNLLDQLRDHPLTGLTNLVARITDGIWIVLVQSWSSVLSVQEILASGKRILGIYLLVVIMTAVLLAVYFLPGKIHRVVSYRSQVNFGLGLIAAGLIICILAGWPVWLIGRNVVLQFPGDRFSLPFILGFTLFFVGILEILPGNLWLRIGFLCASVSLLAGYQYRLGEEYVLDWKFHKNFFWQLNWRIPDLYPGTILLTNKMPFKYYTDNSLIAPLNWLYAPGNHSDRLEYVLYDAEVREGGGKLVSIEPGQDITHDYLGAVFEGNTSDSVAIFHSRRSCVRVLEPFPETNNPLLPVSMKEAAVFSVTERIEVDGSSQLPQLYGPEPEHGWCYFFEKADLARQMRDWTQALLIGEEAVALGLGPKDGSEWYPFTLSSLKLEAYDKALEWTVRGVSLESDLLTFYCQIWRDHVDKLSADDAQAVWDLVDAEISCEEDPP